MKAQDSVYAKFICVVRGTRTILSFHLVPLTKHINLTYILSRAFILFPVKFICFIRGTR
jgi:hypothetical protein